MKICWVSLLRQTYWGAHLELHFLGCGGKGLCALNNNIFLFSIFLNTNWSLLYRIKFKGYVNYDTFAYDMYQGYFIEKVRGKGCTFFASPLYNLKSLALSPHNFIYLDVTLTTPLPQLEFIGTHCTISILFIWMFLHPRITIFGLTPPHTITTLDTHYTMS